MKEEDWKTLDIGDAISGRRVGFKNAEDGSDISETGIVVSAVQGVDSVTNNPIQLYQTKIGRYTIAFKEDGTVTDTVPYNSNLIGQTLKMVDTTIVKTLGTKLKPSDGTDENIIDLSKMQPRDEFAIRVLGELIGKIESPENVDDGNILYTCRAAYRWANGMMAAAAEARSGYTQDYDEVEVEHGDATINVTITNNSANAITIAPRFRFILSTEGKDSAYPYNRTEAASLGDLEITIAAGASVSFTNVVIPGDSKQYEGQHFAESTDYGENYVCNVLLYDTAGNSNTIVPNMMNPSTIFTDGGTYNIVYNGAPQPTV